jgi:hypothetical protein
MAVVRPLQINYFFYHMTKGVQNLLSRQGNPIIINEIQEIKSDYNV